MGGWEAWVKVRSALNNNNWDFRTVDGIAKETELHPEEVNQLLAEHRSELRQTLLRDGRVIYAPKSRPKGFREIFAEIQLFARP